MKQSESHTQSTFSPRKVGYLKALCRAGFDPLTTPETLCDLDFAPIDRKCAFTLAEVLITLGIVGVVAALTLPQLVTNINERVYSTRQANTAYKVTQATDKMKSLGLLNGSYKTTDEFVDELQKHLKVVKRCSANNIADCWPTDKVITSDGKEFKVKNAKTGKNLNIESNTSDNVGLVLADGASIILTYNQDSSGIDEGEAVVAQLKSLPVGFGKSQDFAYTTNTTGAIDFVMDVNGKHGPNSETRDKQYDIRSFKAARFSKSCGGVKIPGIGCVVNLGESYDCLKKGTEDFNKWDPDYDGYRTCWGGAKKACADAGMSLPDYATLYKIYQKKSEYPDKLPQSGYAWSSSDTSTSYHAYGVGFSDGYVGGLYKYHQYGALCLGD